MFKISGLFFVLIALLCGVLLFKTSQSVQGLESRLASIEEINQKEKDEIRVLATEWDYLNSPQRLESLVSEGVQSLQSSEEAFKKNTNAFTPAVPTRKPDLIKVRGQNGHP